MYLFKGFFPEIRHTLHFIFAIKYPIWTRIKCSVRFIMVRFIKSFLYVTILTFYLAFSTVIRGIVRYSTQLGQMKGTGSFIIIC